MELWGWEYTNVLETDAIGGAQGAKIAPGAFLRRQLKLKKSQHFRDDWTNQHEILCLGLKQQGMCSKDVF